MINQTFKSHLNSIRLNLISSYSTLHNVDRKLNLDKSNLIQNKSFSHRKGRIEINDGVYMAYQEWGYENDKKILSLHGWLDNSNSFAFLGPKLASQGYHIIAPDFVGHGQSSHISRGYHNFVYLPYLRDFLDLMGLTRKINIVGHSMGGAIGSCLAAFYPEIFKSLVMIDCFSIWTRSAESAVSVFKNTLESERKLMTKIAQRKDSGPKTYPTVLDAVTARIKTVSTLPGRQALSKEAALALVSRGVYLLDSPDHNDDIIDLSSGPVAFRHDKAILAPNYNFLTNAVALSILNSIECPTLVILGVNGWPIGSASVLESRKEILNNKNLLTFKRLEGSHHLHLDPNDAELTSSEILKFLNNNAV